MNPIVSNGNKLKWKIENMNKLTNKGMFSDQFTFQDVVWEIHVCTITENSVKYLNINLYCDGDSEQLLTWICEAKIVFKVLNQNKNEKDWMREDVSIYDYIRIGLDDPVSIEWSKLESDGYMKDNSIVVEIKLDFKCYDFSKNIPDYTDIIINVDETEFYFNKEALCSRFHYFLKIIYNEKELKIENVTVENVRLFIASLFSVQITDENEKLQKSMDLGSQNESTKPGDYKMNPIVSNGNKLKWKIEKIKELTDDGMLSDKFTFQGVDWKIHVCTEIENSIKYLGVYLHYVGDNKEDKNWICEAKRVLKVLNQNENGKDCTEEDVSFYDASGYIWGYPTFMEWSKLETDGYMKDNSIIVEIELDFKYYDFSKNIPNHTDITFDVQGTKFYFNTEALCSRFDYFLKKRNNENKVKIENVELKHFRLFIASLFSVEITDEIGKLQTSTGLGSVNDTTKPIIYKKMVNVSSKSERNKIEEKQLKCQSCTNMDFEENLQVCQTCNEQNLKHFKNEEEVLKNAICAICAIKNHIRQGHVTDDFLRYYRAYKFENQLESVQTMLAKLQSAEIYWKSKEQTWKTMHETTETKLNELIDLTRRSESTKYLQENMNDVKCFIENAINVNDRSIEIMKNREVLIQENLQKMNEWIEEKSKKCVKDEETIKLEI